MLTRYYNECEKKQFYISLCYMFLIPSHHDVVMRYHKEYIHINCSFDEVDICSS